MTTFFLQVRPHPRGYQLGLARQREPVAQHRGKTKPVCCTYASFFPEFIAAVEGMRHYEVSHCPGKRGAI